jgi:hypothetical protein
MKRLVLISLILMLAGCSTPERSGLSSKHIHLRSGDKGYTIRCSFTYDWPDCYEKAVELCGSNSYVVVDKYDFEDQYLDFREDHRIRAMVTRCL